MPNLAAAKAAIMTVLTNPETLRPGQRLKAKGRPSRSKARRGPGHSVFAKQGPSIKPLPSARLRPRAKPRFNTKLQPGPAKCLPEAILRPMSARPCRA
jgi:hypothetical protein